MEWSKKPTRNWNLVPVVGAHPASLVDLTQPLLKKPTTDGGNRKVVMHIMILQLNCNGVSICPLFERETPSLLTLF